MDWSFSNLSELHQKFGWEEYVVLFVTLFISVLIGVYWAYRGQNTTSEFLMASKQMTLFPTTMSLACRYEKVVTFFLLCTDFKKYFKVSYRLSQFWAHQRKSTFLVRSIGWLGCLTHLCWLLQLISICPSTSSNYWFYFNSLNWNHKVKMK